MEIYRFNEKKPGASPLILQQTEEEYLAFLLENEAVVRYLDADTDEEVNILCLVYDLVQFDEPITIHDELTDSGFVAWDIKKKVPRREGAKLIGVN